MVSSDRGMPHPVMQHIMASTKRPCVVRKQTSFLRRKRVCRHVRFAENVKDFDGLSHAKSILHCLVVDILYGELRSPDMIARACGVNTKTTMVGAYRLLDSLIKKLQLPGTTESVHVGMFRGGFVHRLQQPMLPSLRRLRCWLGSACGGEKENVVTSLPTHPPAEKTGTKHSDKHTSRLQIGVYPPPGYTWNSSGQNQPIHFCQGDNRLDADICVFYVSGQQHFVAVAGGLIKQRLIRDSLELLAESQTQELWSRVENAVFPGSTHPFSQFMEFAYSATPIHDQLKELDSSRLKRMLCMASWMGIRSIVGQCQQQLQLQSWASGADRDVAAPSSLAEQSSSLADASCSKRKRPFCVHPERIAVH